MLGKVRNVPADLEPVSARQRRRIDPRSRDHDHPQARNLPAGLGEALDYASQQALTDPGAADCDDADAFIGPVAQLCAHGLAPISRQRRGVGDVAAEAEVALGPVADLRQSRAEAAGNDVVGLADEDRAVPNARVALDLLDHLGVVIGREQRLVSVA